MLRELQDLGLGPALQAALKRVYKTGGLGRAHPDLTDADWNALSRLTGTITRTLDLHLLDRQLQASRFGTPLITVLETLNGGPVQTAAQQKAAFTDALSGLIDTVSDQDWQGALFTGTAGNGALRRALRGGTADLPQTLDLVSRALGVLRDEVLSLPMLAARLTGNAHALDDKTLAGTLLSAATEALNVTPPQDNGVTSHALSVNLRGPAWLDSCQGHTLSLPWREVKRLSDLHAVKGCVWVVENPSVFEALHEGCPAAALICLNGMPNTATKVLLTRLTAGTRLMLSTDLDYGGLNIVRHLLNTLAHLNWSLWRMTPRDHMTACARGRIHVPQHLDAFQPPLRDLANAISWEQTGAHHETLLPELLADLSAPS